MSHKIVVGYRTRAIDGLNDHMPEFQAPAHYKSDDAIKKYIDEKKAKFQATAHECPYVGVLDEVVLITRNPKKISTISREAGIAASKPPVAVRVSKHLQKLYPEAWTGDLSGERRTDVMFIGFNVRLFLKMVGLECSLPSVAQPAPLRLWYDNDCHRDIGKAILPAEFEQIDLLTALKFRTPLDSPEATKEWQDMLKNWPGPGHQPLTDCKIAIELADQLNMFAE